VWEKSFGDNYCCSTRKLSVLVFRIDLQEEIITDNEVHSDLDPLEAPVWSTSVQFDDQPHCLLSKKLSELISSSISDTTITLNVVEPMVSNARVS